MNIKDDFELRFKDISSYELRLKDKLTDDYIAECKKNSNFVCDNRKRYDTYVSEDSNGFQKLAIIVFLFILFYLRLCSPGKNGASPILKFNKYLFFYSLVFDYILILLEYFISGKYLFDFNDKEVVHKTRFFYDNKTSIIKFDDIKYIGVSVPYKIVNSKYGTNTHYYYEIFFIYLDKNGYNYEIIENGKLGIDNVEYSKLNEVNARASFFSDRFDNIDFYKGEVGKQMGVDDYKLVYRYHPNFKINWDPKISKYLVWAFGLFILIAGYFVYMDTIDRGLYQIKNTTINKTVNSTN